MSIRYRLRIDVVLACGIAVAVISGNRKSPPNPEERAGVRDLEAVRSGFEAKYYLDYYWEIQSV